MPIPDLSNLPGNSRPGRPGGGGGGPTVQQVANKYSFKFDNSSSSYMEIDNFVEDFVTEANTNQGMSVSVWFKTSSISVNYYLFGTGTSQHGAFTAQASGSNPRWTLRDTSGSQYILTTTDSPIAPGGWYHVVYTWDATASVNDRMKIYIDGVLNESTTIAGPTSLRASGTYVNSKGLINAYREQPLNSSSSDTTIDELGLFTRTLNADEVIAIYNATSLNTTANLATLSTGAPYAWYRMGD